MEMEILSLITCLKSLALSLRWQSLAVSLAAVGTSVAGVHRVAGMCTGVAGPQEG